jgi:hypothetical protein
MNKLPKHRQLTIKAMELLFKGNKKESQKLLNQAEKEMNKFYKNNSQKACAIGN